VHVCLRHRKPLIDEYAEEKRTEFDLRRFKSEAEVRLIIDDCARSIVDLLLKLTTGRHEASRGLSATAGLLVVKAFDFVGWTTEMRPAAAAAPAVV